VRGERSGGDGVRGVILGYARSKARTYTSVVLVKLLDSRVNGHSLVGRRVTLVDSHGNKYTGRIVGVHGSRGDVVKVRFKPNIPGQAINSLVSIE